MGSYIKLSPQFEQYTKLPYLSNAEQLKLVKAYKGGDRSAGDKLMTHNIKLVIKSATRFAPFTENIDDLIQEGMLGILIAAQKFKVSKKVRFLTYAVWWVDAYVARCYNTTRTDVRNVRPTHTHVEMSLDDMANSQLDEREDAEYSPAELAVSRTKEPDRNPEDEMIWNELVGIFNDRKRLFKGLDRSIVNDRLLNDEKTLQSIGNKFGVSRERVRQRELDVRRRLKSIMSPYYVGYTG